MDHLPILSGIQPAELRQLGATFSLTYRGTLNPEKILYAFLSESLDACQEKLRFRRLFVAVRRKFLKNLSGLGIRAFE